MEKMTVSEALTDERLAMLKEACSRPIVYDDEMPELTDEQLAKFKLVKKEHGEGRKKQTVTLRLPPRTLNKARSLGKGYTAVLARMLEEDMEDDAKIQRCL